MSYKSALATISLLFCLSQTSVFAAVYKWVDENGQVHYGERPVVTGAEKVEIRQNETTKPRTIKTDEEENANADGAQKQGADNDNNKDEKTEAKPAEGPLIEEKVPKKEKQRLCREAKSDIASISSRGRMREINSKGEYIYLSEKQRQQRLSAARKKQKKYCR